MKMQKNETRGIGKKHIIIFLVGVLLISGAVSYAYFTGITKTTGTGITTVSQTVSYEGTELVTNGVLEFNDTGILPGHQNISSVSVTATGIESLVYNLNWTGTNTLKTPLTYTVYKTDTEESPSITCEKKNGTVDNMTTYYEECTESGFDNLVAVGSGTIGTYATQTKIPLVINEEITATREGTTVYYYVVLEYPNLNESQNYDMGGSFSGVVNTEILGEKEMPVVTLSEEYTEASNGWYSSVTINATGSNSNNTVSKLRYCVTTDTECTPGEDNVINAGSGKVELDSNKNAQRVCFSAVDKSGLVGLATCSNAYLVDKSSTTTTIELGTNTLGDNNWYQAATLNITGNNEVSGIESIKYCVTSTDQCTPDQTVSGSSASVTLSSSATGQKVCATSTDNKGDSSEIACSNLYNVDTVNPTVSINEDYTVTTDSITVNVTATDADSKIASYSYTLNGSAYSSCTTATCTFTGLTSGTEYTVGVSATDLAGRESTLVTKAIKTKAPVKDTIIANAASTTTMPTSITAISTDTSNTLYTVADDDGTSYVFRGNPSNNWVSFGGYYWRIIRINGDGSIRMIYNGTSTTTNGTGTQINGSTYTYSNGGASNDNAYVGFMYGTTGASTYAATHANTNNSNVKSQLESWYTSSGLSSYAEYIDTNAGFCNDRKISSVTRSGYGTLGYGTNATAYAPTDRFFDSSWSWLTTLTPTLKCNQISSDLFTVKGATKGNKTLTNPVGLITVDEVVFAGGFGGTNNTSYYLYTNQAYWTMSPRDMHTDGRARVFSVATSGYLNNPYVFTAIGVRPVINLRSDVTLSGSGTTTSPYTVS